MEPHEILGVGKDATLEEIRAAYRKLAMKWHPDRQLNNREEATRKFAEINGAQRTLLRNIRRAKRKADASQNPSPSSSESSSSSSSKSSCSDSSHTAESTCSSRPTSFGGSSESDNSTPSQSQRKSYASAAGRASTPSSSSQKSGKTRRSKLQKSPPASTSTPSSQRNFNPKTSEPGIKEAHFPECVDATLHPERPILPGAETPKTWTHILNMTLEELYLGKTFHFRVVRFRDSGKKYEVPLMVEVPSGCRDGSEVIMPGAGNQRKDGTWQDIVFLIKELKHDRFQRVHDNLIMDVRLPWVDRLNDEEGEVYSQGVDGREIMFRVDYRKLRLLSGSTVIPDAGMMLRNGNGRGKLVIRWEISSPMSSWESLKEVLKFKKGRH